MLRLALIRVTLNAGFMKPRRGFTLVAGKEKLGVGKLSNGVDKGVRFRINLLVIPRKMFANKVTIKI